MSVRQASPMPAAFDAAIATDFLYQFVRDVHTIVAEGYSRLNPVSLASEHEPTISGLIVKNGRAWLDAADTPDWVQRYFIVEEKYDDESDGKGMGRPRADIYVESSCGRPRQRFVFEAKRFYANAGENEYLGDDGLGALRDGTYTKKAAAAGMLGYVQQQSPQHWFDAVEARLKAEPSTYGLAEGCPVWTTHTMDERLGVTRCSLHQGIGREPIAVYHSFLRCA